MDAFLNKFHFLKSRKFWAAVSATTTVLATAFQADVFPAGEVILSLTAIAVGYMGGTAYEDAAAKKAGNL